MRAERVEARLGSCRSVLSLTVGLSGIVWLKGVGLGFRAPELRVSCTQEIVVRASRQVGPYICTASMVGLVACVKLRGMTL